jgi:hypothetical protein
MSDAFDQIAKSSSKEATSDNDSYNKIGTTNSRLRVLGNDGVLSASSSISSEFSSFDSSSADTKIVPGISMEREFETSMFRKCEEKKTGFGDAKTRTAFAFRDK